jgi:hypothetical protein
MLRVAPIAVLLSLSLVACGSSGAKHGVAALKPDSTPSTLVGDQQAGSTVTTAPGSGGPASGNGTGGTGGTGAPTTVKGGAPTNGTNGTTTTTKPHRPVTAKLDKSCVHRGAAGDEQGITVHTDPSDTVAYSTEYSDHSNELSHPSYKTGSGYGKASTDGEYHTTWKLPEDATTGTATVHFIAENKVHDEIPLTFKVAGPLDKCP